MASLIAPARACTSLYEQFVDDVELSRVANALRVDIRKRDAIHNTPTMGTRNNFVANVSKSHLLQFSDIFFSFSSAIIRRGAQQAISATQTIHTENTLAAAVYTRIVIKPLPCHRLCSFYLHNLNGIFCRC